MCMSQTSRAQDLAQVYPKYPMGYIIKDLLWELANATMEAMTCPHVPSAAGEQGRLVV